MKESELLHTDLDSGDGCSLSRTRLSSVGNLLGRGNGNEVVVTLPFSGNQTHNTWTQIRVPRQTYQRALVALRHTEAVHMPHHRGRGANTKGRVA